MPRNRVFSHYATRCGTERVPPLNPASFGKLVRIIFPGIQTRRLGVRGESKYHYVDLSLVDEQQDDVLDVERVQIIRDVSVPSERPNLKRYVSMTRTIWFFPSRIWMNESSTFQPDTDLSLLPRAQLFHLLKSHNPRRHARRVGSNDHR